MIVGAWDPQRIKVDIVHTFHIGVGCDACASMVVWLCKLGKFGNHDSFDDRLREAYSTFMQYCHDNHRYTACEEWSKKNLGMPSML